MALILATIALEPLANAARHLRENEDLFDLDYPPLTVAAQCADDGAIQMVIENLGRVSDAGRLRVRYDIEPLARSIKLVDFELRECVPLAAAPGVSIIPVHLSCYPLRLAERISRIVQNRRMP